MSLVKLRRTHVGNVFAFKEHTSNPCYYYVICNRRSMKLFKIYTACIFRFRSENPFSIIVSLPSLCPLRFRIRLLGKKCFYNFAVIHLCDICSGVLVMLLWTVFTVKTPILHRSVWGSWVAARAVCRDQMLSSLCGSGNDFKVRSARWYVMYRVVKSS